MSQTSMNFNARVNLRCRVALLKFTKTWVLNPWHIQVDLFSIEGTPYNLSVGRLNKSLVGALF